MLHFIIDYIQMTRACRLHSSVISKVINVDKFMILLLTVYDKCGFYQRQLQLGLKVNTELIVN